MADLIDPDRSTSPAFNRKAFVGLSAGAAALATTAAASAQAVRDPRHPLVAEDDPAIRAMAVTLPRDIALDAYVAHPVNAGPATPGVVVVQAIWGVDAQLRDVVRRYAKAGYIAIAPALFTRSHPPSGDGSSNISDFRPLAAALKPEVVRGDIDAAHAYIRDGHPKAKIGLTGFCMGGGIVIKTLIDNTDFAAAAPFYGDVRSKTSRDQPAAADEFAYAKRITTPVRGNYGARDTGIAADDVRAMFAQLAGPHELSIYDEAGHAFFDDTRASYVPGAASDAWTKTLAWFSRYLT